MNTHAAPPPETQQPTKLAPPKLPPEHLELAKQLQADAPEEPVRWGYCAGTPEAAHPPAFYVGYLQVGGCDTCGREIPETALVFPKARNGGNGRKEGNGTNGK